MERQSLISVVKAGWAFSRNGLSWRTVPFRASALESRSPVGFLSASPLLLFGSGSKRWEWLTFVRQDARRGAFLPAQLPLQETSEERSSCLQSLFMG